MVNTRPSPDSAMENYVGYYVTVIRKGDCSRINGILGLKNSRIEIKNARITGSSILYPCLRLKVDDIQKMDVVLLKHEYPSISYEFLEPLLSFTLLPIQSLFTTNDPSPFSKHPGGSDFGVMNQNVKPYKLWEPEKEDTKSADNIDGSLNTISEPKEDDAKPSYRDICLRNLAKAV